MSFRNKIFLFYIAKVNKAFQCRTAFCCFIAHVHLPGLRLFHHKCSEASAFAWVNPNYKILKSLIWNYLMIRLGEIWLYIKMLLFFYYRIKRETSFSWKSRFFKQFHSLDTRSISIMQRVVIEHKNPNYLKKSLFWLSIFNNDNWCSIDSGDVCKVNIFIRVPPKYVMVTADYYYSD